MDITNNNNLIWYKTSEVEPPARTKLWVCQVGWSHRTKQGMPAVKLDSWDGIKKSWRHFGNSNLEYIYWTYPIYPEIK